MALYGVDADGIAGFILKIRPEHTEADIGNFLEVLQEELQEQMTKRNNGLIHFKHPFVCLFVCGRVSVCLFEMGFLYYIALLFKKKKKQAISSSYH